MSKESILVVDDEQDILELVRYNLMREGFVVTCVKTSEDAAKSISSRQPSLVILDLMLPGVNGLEFCRRLKSNAETASIPVLMLTAKSEDIDIVTGLDLGADDYMTKPFSPRVLIARVRALIRRDKAKESSVDKVIRIHNISLHLGCREVKVDDRSVELTYTEFNILYLLASRPGWVFSRQEITEIVKGGPNEVTDRAIDVHVVGLRKKLGDASIFIETVRGVGYKFRE